MAVRFVSWLGRYWRRNDLRVRETVLARIDRY